jgi:hypothetical protein
MKKQILPVVMAACVGLISGCGKSSDATATTPDPATQPEAQAALFQRTCDRATSLIERKDFVQAQLTLDVLKGYKLNAEQQQLVDKLQAQIPKTN